MIYNKLAPKERSGRLALVLIRESVVYDLINIFPDNKFLQIVIYFCTSLLKVVV